LKDACKGCQERHTACWGSCPKYLEARAKHEKEKQEKIKAAQADSAIRDVQYYGLKRQRKREGQHGKSK